MVSDIELKTIEKRLDGIREGILRIRRILIVTIIASSAIFFVLFNSNFSRVRFFALDQRNNVVKSEGKTFADQGTEVLLNDWYKSRNIQVNFLGVSVNVTDLPIVGSITLTVITIWYFYSYRQANRNIVEALREISEREKANHSKSNEEIIRLRRMIHTSITQTSIFTKNDTLRTITVDGEHSGKPAILDEFGSKCQGQTKEGLRIIKWGRVKASRAMGYLDARLLGESDRPIWLSKDLVESVESEPATFTDKLVKLMFYLPFWTTLSIFAREIVNLLNPSPIYGIRRPQIVSMYLEGQYWSIFLAFIFSAFALICAIYLLVLCNGCWAFSQASTESLWEFNKATLRMEGTLVDDVNPDRNRIENQPPVKS